MPDVVRAMLEGTTLRIRNPGAVRPWQHVLNPLSGYLMLAQALWSSPEFATGWNFGPPDEEVRPVSGVVESLRGRWSGRPTWEHDSRPHPPEAGYLKLDSSRARSRLGWRPPVSLETALDSIADWYDALLSGADMRAVTLGQIDELGRAAASPDPTIARRER